MKGKVGSTTQLEHHQIKKFKEATTIPQDTKYLRSQPIQATINDSNFRNCYVGKRSIV